MIESRKPLLSDDWIRAMHFVQFMKMLHTFTRGWDESEFIGVLNQLDHSFHITNKFANLIEMSDVSKVPLEVEMKLRLMLRSLVWDLVGDDYSLRASWISSTLRYFSGNDSKQQAMFFLVTFGYSCED